MTDDKKLEFLGPDAERILDLDSIPGMAEIMSAALRNVFGMPDSTNVSNATEWIEQIRKFSAEEFVAKLHKNCIAHHDPNFLSMLTETVYVAAAINRHDDFEAGDRFTTSDHCEQLPWIWITGEPNTDRRKVASLIVSQCPKRSFKNSKLVDCESDDEETVLEYFFGSYFEPVPGNELRSAKIVDLNNSFLLFYKAEKMSPNCQRKLITWRQNGRDRREAPPVQIGTDHQDRSIRKSDDLQKIIWWKEKIDLLEVAPVFISDRAPWELVEQGLVMRELVSGSIHLPVPPLRECPKLIVSRLRQFIVNKSTLSAPVSDPLKYWSKEALDAVCSFHWPDNLAGLRGLVDTLFFKGALRSGEDQITEQQIRGALWEMYGPASLITSQNPVQTGSSDSLWPITTSESRPQRKLADISDDELKNRWENEFKDSPGGKTLMAKALLVDYRNLCKRLSSLGCTSNALGRPKKRA